MPLKIEVIDEDPETIKPNFRSKEMAIAQNVLNLSKNDQLPTIWNTIGNREYGNFTFLYDLSNLFKTQKTYFFNINVLILSTYMVNNNVKL